VGVIETLLPKTRRSILGLLFSHPDESFYLSEIVRSIGGSLGTVRRELLRLVDAGLLTRSRRGNQTHYRANEACPIFPELRGLILKTVGLVDVLRVALEGLDGVRVAFVYGSFAQGEARAESDIDVMVIGNVTFAKVCEHLRPAQEQLRREVNPVVYSVREFRRKVAAQHDFLTEVLQHEKLFVIGDADVLGELVPARAA